MTSCLHCGTEFEQHSERKKFCSLKCYTTSDYFKGMQRARAEQQKRRVEINCAECGNLFIAKLSRKDQKTCSRLCQRRWFEKRFDRFVASKINLHGVTNFDEFLTQDELPCLVEGCSWHGKNLGMHMNVTHGITAERVKELAGFNKTSGLVSADLHEAMGQRPQSQAAAHWMGPPTPETRVNRGGKWSTEARERIMKGRALTPTKTVYCIECGTPFEAKRSHAKVCSALCQDRVRQRRVMTPGTCSVCGTGFTMKRSQVTRAKDGLPIVCSMKCREDLRKQPP